MLAALKAWLLKRRLQKQADQAVEEIKQKWIYFNNAVSFNEGMVLSKRIDLFTMPIMAFMEERYPMLVIHPDMFWSIFWTAIFESKTHPLNEFRTAQEAMHASYRAGNGLHSDNA